MAEARKVVTGQDENGNDIEAYEFGAEIDGTFVPFVTKPASYIEHLAEARKSREQEQAAQQDEAESSGSES